MAGFYWRDLRITMFAWLTVLSLLGMLLALVLYRQRNAEEALAEAEKQWQHSQQQAMQYASYQAEMSYYLAHREQWQASGLMQLPDFDQWGSVWANLQQQFSLPHLAYQIQPSMACPGGQCRQQSPLKQFPELNFTVTPIQISWSVHHELDVSQWLRALQRQYHGMLLVRRCQWQLAEQAASIAVQCDLAMFNFPNVLAMAGSS
ncbi:hypothetical protein [Methylophilus methylotrophus]|uniref:hypothetical protein n=1 Tax=Methylophilus methylotrophus TaxID=17 RepID=UPI0003771A68|nr:hypothetical protein [Methylophilus methylotrophus]